MEREKESKRESKHRRLSLPGSALCSPCLEAEKGDGTQKATVLRARRRSLAALGLGYVLWDMSMLDHCGNFRVRKRVLPFEPNEHFPFGLL